VNVPSLQLPDSVQPLSTSILDGVDIKLRKSIAMEPSQSNQESQNMPTEAAVPSAAQESAADRSALTEFTLFPKLPIELRFKIFRYNLPTGPHGMRWLKVRFRAFKIISKVNNPAATATEGLQFRLLHHDHNIYLKDMSLLSACPE